MLIRLALDIAREQRDMRTFNLLAQLKRVFCPIQFNQHLFKACFLGVGKGEGGGNNSFVLSLDQTTNAGLCSILF